MGSSCAGGLALAILPATFIAMLGMAYATPASAAPSLYERLGGEPGVKAIVNDGIDLYMIDPRLHGYFDNINPDWLKPRFATYICAVADGPCVYRHRSMAATHKALRVDQAAFDATVEDLQQAMRQRSVPFWIQNRLLARLAPLERAIVTR